MVLTDVPDGLHYGEITERILSSGLKDSVGATPAQTVNSRITTSLRDPSSLFYRVSPGVYRLKGVTEKTQNKGAATENKNTVEETGALRAFGMYWQRDLVLWTGTPTLFGTQGAGATNVNFAGQIGVYLLHDRERVIYVGRTRDTLYLRLKAHTSSRLGGRWDRFSWFGLQGVEEDGKLSKLSSQWDQNIVIETMEAVLIESLEPPLNRRAGDNLAGIEYIQAIDSRIEMNKNEAIIRELLQRTSKT